MTTLELFSNGLFVFIGLLTLPLSTTSTLVIRQPSNWTSVSGSDVFFSCEVIDGLYDGFFEWRVFRVIEFGQRIYSGSNLSTVSSYTQDERFPADKYRRDDVYGLNITGVDWKDGAVYQCDFITADTKSTSRLIVIDELIASVGVSTIDAPSSSDGSTTRTQLTCSVSFGGPQMFDAKTCKAINGDLPRLQMSLGSAEPFDDSATNVSCVLGSPGLYKHVLTVSLVQTLSSADIGKQLTCSLSTQSPAFKMVNSTIIQILTPAHNVSIESHREVHVVDDVINCTAQGWPEPKVVWRPVETPQSVSEAAPLGPSLRVVPDMVGWNVWECAAANNIDDARGTEVVTRISFNVTDDVYKNLLLARGRDKESVARAQEDNNQRVALAVGLALGLLGLVGLGIVIALLLVRKRSRFAQNGNGKPATVSSIYSYTTVLSETEIAPKEVVTPQALEPSALPTTSSAPIYQPRPATVPRSRPPSVLDRSGHGDLGFGIFHLNSTTTNAVEPMYAGGHPAHGAADGRHLMNSNNDLTSAPYADLHGDHHVNRRVSRTPSFYASSDVQSPSSSIAGGFADLGITSGSRQNGNLANNTIGRLSRTSSLNRSRDYVVQQPPRRQSAVIDEEDLASYYDRGAARPSSAVYRPAVAEKSAKAAEIARALKRAAEEEMDSTRSSSLVTSELATVI